MKPSGSCGSGRTANLACEAVKNEHYGFIACTDNPMTLYLPLGD